MLATSDSLRKFYEKNSYALLKDANTLTELIVLAEFWEDVSNQDTERFSNRVLKRFFCIELCSKRNVDIFCIRIFYAK